MACSISSATQHISTPELSLAELQLEGSDSLKLFELKLFILPLLFPLELIWPPDGNVLGPKVGKGLLQHLFDDPAAAVIGNHDAGQSDLEVVGKGDELQLLVDFGNKLGGARKGDTGDQDNAPVHATVFLDRLTEGSALVVDGKRRDLLNQLEQVDGRVEQRRLKVALEVHLATIMRLGALDILRDVD